jgi:hypothetical protein
MEVGVAEVADVLGVSPMRVRHMIAAGDLSARRVSGRWLVESQSLPSARRRGRPMSENVAWQFAGPEPSRNVSSQDRYRRRRRRAQLASDAEPEQLLRSWMASRAERRLFHSNEPGSLVQDPRFVPSGVSDPRSRMSVAGVVEGYVLAEDLKSVQRSHLLSPATADANIVIHVSPHLPESPVPLLLLAADLAEHGGPRELARARELIEEALA